MALHNKTLKLARNGMTYFFLILGGAFILLPFLWMISTSLKLPGTEFNYPPEWIPRPANWANYTVAWTSLPFTRWFFNTVLITVLAITGSLVSSTLVAYGFSRFSFPGRKILFVILLSTMMLPNHILIIPNFILFKYLGWINTYLPLTVPFFLGRSVFHIFLMRQFFMSIPYEMDEGAIVDGAGYLVVFTRILLPMSKAALGIVVVFQFMASWNDFMGPLIYLSKMARFTLSIGLRFYQQADFVETNLTMAVSIIVLLPPVILFFIAQKYYIQGVVTTGIKG